jgi:DNA polymerase-3 subunit beta
MKFQVPSKTLYNYTSAVSKVINAKNALQILNNFLFVLDGDTLTISGSDTENALTARVPVSNAEGSGKFCIDARRLVDLLKQLPDEGINFEINESNLEVNISSSNGNYDLMGLNGDEYPQYKKEDEGVDPVNFIIPAEQIIKGIDNTLFAVSSDEFRPQMMGIYLDIKPEAITFVATDTRKLVKYTNSMAEPGVTGSCIMPIKPATVLKNVFAKEELIHVTLTRKCATIESESFTFNCRFIKGNFPDYNRVIPQNNPRVVTVDRGQLLNAVRRVGVFVDSNGGLVRFRITQNMIELKAQDVNTCTMAQEKISCSYEGDELVIGFSVPYLIEIFGTLSTEDIVIALSDPGRPGVFSLSENEENSELIILLMPMAVGDF